MKRKYLSWVCALAVSNVEHLIIRIPLMANLCQRWKKSEPFSTQLGRRLARTTITPLEGITELKSNTHYSQMSDDNMDMICPRVFLLAWTSGRYRPLISTANLISVSCYIEGLLCCIHFHTVYSESSSSPVSCLYEFWLGRQAILGLAQSHVSYRDRRQCVMYWYDKGERLEDFTMAGWFLKVHSCKGAPSKRYPCSNPSGGPGEGVICMHLKRPLRSASYPWLG